MKTLQPKVIYRNGPYQNYTVSFENGEFCVSYIDANYRSGKPDTWENNINFLWPEWPVVTRIFAL